MFRYERVNSKRKFSIVAEIVFLLKKIYKRDAPLRAMFNVKTLAVLFSPYPREMKTNTAKFIKICRPFDAYLFPWKLCNPFPRAPKSHARGLSMRTHLTAVFARALDPWRWPRRSQLWVREWPHHLHKQVKTFFHTSECPWT